jgi:hypothetical protein
MQVHGANIPFGTAIATFPNGKYSGHAAIYTGQDVTGIQVWDQVEILSNEMLLYVCKFFSGLIILFHNELFVGMVLEFRIMAIVFMLLIKMNKNIH